MIESCTTTAMNKTPLAFATSAGITAPSGFASS
jgi:hypothetical protein